MTQIKKEVGMKTITGIILGGLLILMLGVAQAQFVGPGLTNVVTVKSILDKPVDDMFVTLKGYIIQKLSHDKYLFKDNSGEIRVDIDEKYFPYGTPITTQTVVMIKGEVDKDFMTSPEIEVKQLEIVPSGRDASSVKEKSKYWQTDGSRRL